MTITSTLPIVAERAMWWGRVPMDRGQRRDRVHGDRHDVGDRRRHRRAARRDESDVRARGERLAHRGHGPVTVVYDDGTSEQKDYALSATRV